MIARSRSKLKRIHDRLKGAIRNILDMTKTQQPEIDYASLISLSNSSRADAIKTMDDLSRRLNKPSSTSVARKRKSASSSTSSSSSKSKSKSKSESKPKDVQEPKDAQKKTQGSESDSRKSDKVKASSGHHRKDAKTGKAIQKPKSTAPSTSTSLSSHPQASKQTRSTDSRKQKRAEKEERQEAANRVGALPPNVAAASSSSSSSPTPRKLRKPPADAKAPNRISYASMSSDSTKLGEIPLRRSRLAWDPEAGDFEYGFRPVYPLHAPPRPAAVAAVAEDRAPGFFRRVFGGGGGGAREKE